MRRFWAILLLLRLCADAVSATYYIDSSAGGANTGVDRANAFTSINNTTPTTGDTCYVRANRTYSVTTWTPRNGVTYLLDPIDTANNIVISGGGSGNYGLSGGFTNVVIDFRDPSNNPRGLLTNFVTLSVNNDSCTAVTLRGISFPRAVRMYSSSHIEISYCVFYFGFAQDYLIGLSSPVQYGAYGINSVHHNKMFAAKNASGSAGDDFCQNAADIDWYDNEMTGYVVIDAFAGTQHMDGFQTGNNYIRFYNNRCTNIANTMFFGEFFSNARDIQVFNNLDVWTDSTNTTTLTRGVEMASRTGSTAISSIYVWNNTFVDLKNHSAINMVKLDDLAAVWSGNEVVNNVAYNCGQGGNAAMSSTVPSGILWSCNVAIAGPSGNSTIPTNSTNAVGSFSFLSYSQFSSANDLRPAVDVTGTYIGSINGYGDIVGASRSAADWTVGAYEWASQGGVLYSHHRRRR